jgi:hypothetical protein
MDFASSWSSFSMPTHTHDFGNHRNGYDRSKTALVQSVSGSPENCLFNGLKSGNDFGTWRGLQFLRLPYCLVD